MYYWFARIWDCRRFFWFECSFTQKNTIIILLYVLETHFCNTVPRFLKKIRLRRALITLPYCISIIVAGTCRDRLHCVSIFVHQSDGKFWETSFSLRHFLYTFSLLYTFSERANVSHGRRGRENRFQLRMALGES